ncbi:MAG: hypothetical protein B7X41_08925, partial [Microbacterium sp. 14-71-5]
MHRTSGDRRLLGRAAGGPDRRRSRRGLCTGRRTRSARGGNRPGRPAVGRGRAPLLLGDLRGELGIGTATGHHGTPAQPQHAGEQHGRHRAGQEADRGQERDDAPPCCGSDDEHTGQHGAAPSCRGTARG